MIEATLTDIVFIIYSIPENGSKPVDVLSLEGSTVLKINTFIVYSIPENAYKPQMSSHKVGGGEDFIMNLIN